MLILHLFIKNDPTEKSNYRPVIVLPIISKLFERQIGVYMQNYTRYTLNHDLLIVKLHAYGSDIKALQLLSDR